MFLFIRNLCFQPSLTKYYICIARDAFALKNLFPILALRKSPLTSLSKKFKLKAGFSHLYFCTCCLWNKVSKCWISEEEQIPFTQTFPHRALLMSFPPLLPLSPPGHSPLILHPFLWLWTDTISARLLHQGKPRTAAASEAKLHRLVH